MAKLLYKKAAKIDKVCRFNCANHKQMPDCLQIGNLITTARFNRHVYPVPAPDIHMYVYSIYMYVWSRCFI